MATKKQLLEDNKNLLKIISSMGGMLSRQDDEESVVKAKLLRPSYRIKPDSFEVKITQDDEGIMVSVGDAFELYETVNGGWTVRLVGIGMNQYQAFADIVPLKVQIEALKALMEK